MNLANARQVLPQASPAAGHLSDSLPSILALDLGSTTGWALRNDRCRILHGTAEFRPTRFEGGGMRYLRFERWLDETSEDRRRHRCGLLRRGAPARRH